VGRGERVMIDNQLEETAYDESINRLSARVFTARYDTVQGKKAHWVSS
jgi:hypothetical protein